ncbi:MAG: NADPH-dependent FMN reductase [Bacteroidota bacterium]
MNLLCISGSASKDSSNYFLLKAIEDLFHREHQVNVYQGLYNLPLFYPDRLEEALPKQVQEIKSLIKKADLVLIATPEYTHNIPAVLKNLIEWCTHSGEFHQKRTLAITFTPKEPRGKFAMQSLIQSLQAMESKVIGQLDLYKTDVIIQDRKIKLPPEIASIFKASLGEF